MRQILIPLLLSLAVVTLLACSMAAEVNERPTVSIDEYFQMLDDPTAKRLSLLIKGFP